MFMIRLDDPSEWAREDDVIGDLKTSTQEQVSKVIGHQISDHHEWLPQSVIGLSGLRPFDPSTDKQNKSNISGVRYSREGVKATAPFTSASDTTAGDVDVKDEEWEVS